MALRTDRSADHSRCHEVRQAVIGGVHCGQPCDRASSIGDNHFLAGAYTVDVLAQAVLEFTDPDLGTDCSYIHADSVATSGFNPANIHVDHDTFSDVLIEAELLPERSGDPFADPQPVHESERLCHSEHGDPVDPLTVLQLMIEGYIRFVILNDDRVPIQWGRTRRLFEGAARDAVRAMFPRCTHPGCRVRTKRTQTDHTVDDAKGGTTDPANGNPRCRRHNNAKNHGYTVYRDALGEFHTYRPDGTEIG